MILTRVLFMLALTYCVAGQDENDVEVITTPESTAKPTPSTSNNKNNKKPAFMGPPPLELPGAFLYSDPFFPVVLPLAPPSMRGVVQLKEYADNGVPRAGGVGGDLLLQQFPGGPLLITGNITGLPAGKHSLSVHALGDLRKGCDSLGPIFDYGFQAFHNVPPNGGPPVLIGSAGDLGNVEAGSDGTATVRLLSTSMQLCEPHSVLGRSFVVREKENDYRTADLGKRLLCGVVGIL